MKLIVTRENQGQRIDKFLKEGFFCNEDTSRGEIVKLIKDEKVLVGSKAVKPSYILKENDEIELMKQEAWNMKQKKVVPNSEMKFKIIFKNDDFLIIEKPAGLTVHPTSFDEKDTLINGLVAKFPEIEEIGDDHLRPGIVHRLDKETSGVMIVARDQKNFEEFKKKFKEKKIEKTYLALVHGHLKEKKGKIEKSIARSSNYKKQVIAGRKTKTKIRPAVTEYEVLKSFSNFDLVEVKPKTGRMHQIRIHLFSLGHPVVGDKKYKLKKMLEEISSSRHLLHSAEVEFALGGKRYKFSSPMPNDFTQFIESK